MTSESYLDQSPEVQARFARIRQCEKILQVRHLSKSFVTPQGKIFSRKRSGSCGKHQRQLKMAVKYARYLALIPYVG